MSTCFIFDIYSFMCLLFKNTVYNNNALNYILKKLVGNVM